MAVVLRRAVEADAGELLTLQRAAYATTAQLYRDPFLPPLLETCKEVAEAIRSQIVLAAVDGHRIVGSVRVRVEGSVGHMGRLVVAPDREGAGVGIRLLKAIQDQAPPSVRRFELFTGALSTRHIALYWLLGFEEFDRRWSDEGIELVYMARERA
ncbi:MAG TPA: GNAT family N-acetyltransferase [Brevundimonas sp.]|nr:GNAT family N-acetyltransferase [Brevundimonas sp.]